MVKTEIDDRAAPLDTRTVIAEGKRYHFKTTTHCTTCSHSDRPLYAKMILNSGSDVVVECPVCESYYTTKTALISRAE